MHTADQRQGAVQVAEEGQSLLHCNLLAVLAVPHSLLALRIHRHIACRVIVSIVLGVDGSHMLLTFPPGPPYDMVLVVMVRVEDVDGPRVLGHIDA